MAAPMWWGRTAGELEALIRRQAAGDGPAIRIGKSDVTVGAGAGTAQVWLVRFDPRIVQVPIARGENGGVTLPHKNVVKELVKLGGWNGKPVTYSCPSAGDGVLRDAVLVQAGPGGAIAGGGARLKIRGKKKAPLRGGWEERRSLARHQWLGPLMLPESPEAMPPAMPFWGAAMPMPSCFMAGFFIGFLWSIFMVSLAM